MKVKAVKAPKAAAKARLQKRIIARKVAPWDRPTLVLPYGPAHFTVEQIREAVEK